MVLPPYNLQALSQSIAECTQTVRARFEGDFSLSTGNVLQDTGLHDETSRAIKPGETKSASLLLCADDATTIQTIKGC